MGIKENSYQKGFWFNSIVNYYDEIMSGYFLLFLSKIVEDGNK